MAAQKGSDLLLKVDTDGLGTYATVGGLRTKSLSFNAEQVDITNSDSVNKWRELLADAGIKSASASGDGVFVDDAQAETVRSYFFNGTIRNWQIIIPDFGTVQGLFHIENLEYSGDHNAELTSSMSLDSAGPLTFTAA